MCAEKSTVKSVNERRKDKTRVNSSRVKKKRKIDCDSSPSETNNSINMPIRKTNKNSMKHPFKGRPRTDEIWFDGVSPALIAASREEQAATAQSLVKPSSFQGPTRRIAIDCEFVGVGYEGKDNALARVSIVNQFGHVLLDTLVRPEERVTDYRTRVSGIRPSDLRPDGPARPFRAVHQEVAKLCKGRVVVGHAVGHDLKVLMISHPRRDIRDTSRYKPFRALFNGRVPSLRNLTEKVLGVRVQDGEHDSVEDARAAMRLYTSVKRVWESGRKGRKALGFVFSASVADTPNQLASGSEKMPKAAYLNPLDEFESGLSEPTEAPQNPSKSIVRSNRRAWDSTRNRRCSKKRLNFIQKRRARNRFESARH